jgi:hypothetical protein
VRPNKRRHGRLRVAGLDSNWGPIENISASGLSFVAKLRRKPRLDDAIRLKLRCGEMLLTVSGLVRRVESLSFYSHRIAVELRDMTAEQEQGLIDLTHYASVELVAAELVAAQGGHFRRR